MNRREFLAGAGALAVASPASATGASSVRFCAFTDLHYWPRCYSHDSTEFLDAILARAVAAKCDFVVQLGDLVHDVRKYRAFVDRYVGFGKLPTYSVLGNHEDEFTDHAAVLEAFRLERSHYFWDCRGFRFIAVDPHFIRRADGSFEHFANWNWHTARKEGLTLFWLPPEQKDWLKRTIATSPHPCVIMSHESFERPAFDNGIHEQEEMRAFFESENAKRPGHVRLVINGHQHIDHLRILNGIPYLDLNSANYFYAGKKHDRYPADYAKTHGGAKLTYVYDKPLSAVIELSADGRIRIDGARADWYLGITPEQGGHSGYDSAQRRAVPQIQSADFTMTMG